MYWTQWFVETCPQTELTVKWHVSLCTLWTWDKCLIFPRSKIIINICKKEPFRHSWWFLCVHENQIRRWNREKRLSENENSVSQTHLQQSPRSTNETALWDTFLFRGVMLKRATHELLSQNTVKSETRGQLLEMGENYFYLYHNYLPQYISNVYYWMCRNS